ncbi:MAG: DHHA1 domain-containing protein [Pseudomonadota bacterium]
MKCFYHSADLDGHCSAAIVKMKYPECELIGINYGQPFPWEKVGDPLEDVYMVDFSLQPFSDMLKLNGICHLTWIDHHIAAIRSSVESGYDTRISGRRTDGTAACQLVWEWLFPGDPFPRAVYLLGRYDVWDHTDPNVLPFQYGFRMMDTDPGRNPRAMAAVWKLFLEDLNEGELACNSFVRDGRIILGYISQENAKYCRAGALETEIGGLKCIAVNKLMASSQLFDSIWDPEKYQAMAAFGMRADGKWTVSLYSTREDVDVSVVCKALGGGGHKGAAGFQSETVPFERRTAGSGNSVEVDAAALEILQQKAGLKV